MSERIRIVMYVERQVKRGDRWDMVHLVNKELTAALPMSGVAELAAHDALREAVLQIELRASGADGGST